MEVGKLEIENRERKVEVAGLHGGEFYRYMSVEEARAVPESGLLRGGRPGRTYWTSDLYEQAEEAVERLALKDSPLVRMRFRIRNEPHTRKRGDEVEPALGRGGGGTEWMSQERVEVEVISVDQLG